MTIRLIALALALAGCAKGDVEDAKPAPEATNGAPVTSLAEIEGLWLVERFGDFTPGWQNGAGWRRSYVEVRKGGLAYAVGCNHSGNAASLGADGILRDHSEEGGRLQTLMGCPPEQEQRDGRFFAFFGTNPQVTRMAPDRIRLASSAGELVLVTPAAWRRANAPALSEITGRWVPQSSTTYEGAGSRGSGFERDGAIIITEDSIDWTACAEAGVGGRWDKAAQFTVTRAPTGTCRMGEAFPGHDAGLILARILAAGPAVVRTGEHHITLVAGSDEVTLESEASVLNPPPLPPPPLPLPPGVPPPPPPLR